MTLKKSTVIEILELKTQDEINRQKRKKGVVLLSNRNIAERVLGSSSAESSVRRLWAEYKKVGNYRGITVAGGLAGGSIEVKQAQRKKLSGNRFVITSAQNNTVVHEDFFQALLQYCDHNDAELIVSGFHYNKNGFQNGVDEETWYDQRLLQYMVNESVQLAEGLVFCGELNISPYCCKSYFGIT